MTGLLGFCLGFATALGLVATCLRLRRGWPRVEGEFPAGVDRPLPPHGRQSW